MNQKPDYKILMQNALVELREMRAKINNLERQKTEPIAIVGIGCRFPQADNPETFWQLLHQGKDAISEVPCDRWNIDEYYNQDPQVPGKMYTRYGGFIEQLAEFDAQFFGIAPREATSLDPQQRLLLEVSWEALENAGIIPQKLANSQTGVFIGISSSDYFQQLLARDLTDIDAYLATGNAHSIAAGRLSFLLGLTGPSLAVDTACSSSLVAVHLAIMSLRNRECHLALAGGVNRILSPEFNINFCKANMLAPDGRCKTFDAAADGFVRGEGCGIIVLKRLSDAIADKNNILALIRGSAINQDGRSSGLTVPNGISQQTVIRQALENGKIEPAQVNYIEAHGTGTALGDPIEVSALGAVFSQYHSQDNPLLIGSVKTNFGHLEATAGIAGLIKVVLALHNQEIPPHLHLQQPSPYIDWDKLSIAVTTQSIPWFRGEKPRIAGVSSFGFSGTNAHVVLEEAPVNERKPLDSEPEAQREDKILSPVYLLTLSAKSDKALQELAQRYEAYLTAHSTLNLGEICFSANTGRSHFSHRLSLVVSSTAEVREKLIAFRNEEESSGIFKGIIDNQELPQISFLFTGQGSQYIKMGEELYQTQPIFRNALERCAEILRNYLDKPLLEIIYPFVGEENCSLLDETVYTQPALFALEYSLYQLWNGWGIQPNYVLGHSVGEYVAACIAGVFSLEDGLKLIATRARLMQALPPIGKMVVVSASEDEIITIISPYQDQVAIAAINGVENTVISGEKSPITKIIKTLKQQGIKTKILQVSHAFHSPLMKPMLAEFELAAQQINYSLPRIKLISNLTGNVITDEIATPDYWCRHIRQPVRFAQGITTLAQLGCKIFLEIGPKPTLLGMINRANIPVSTPYECLPSLRTGQSDCKTLLLTLAAIYTKGFIINWSELNNNYLYRHIPLPTYPFQRQSYWFKKNKSTYYNSLKNSSTGEESYLSPGKIRQEKKTFHPLLGQKLNLAPIKTIYFENILNLKTLNYLQDHKVFDTIVLPMAAYIEMIVAAQMSMIECESVVIEKLVIQQPLTLSLENEKKIQFILMSDQSFAIYSLTTAQAEKTQNWVLNVSGKVFSNSSEVKNIDLNALQKKCNTVVDINYYYEQFPKRGINYGDNFKILENLWQHKNQALGKINLSNYDSYSISNYHFHPILLDGCLQVIGACFSEEHLFKSYLPTELEKCTINTNLAKLTELWSYVDLDYEQYKAIELSSNFSNREKFSPVTANLKIFASEKQTLATIERLKFKEITSEIEAQQSFQDWLYEIEWITQELSAAYYPFPDYLLAPEKISCQLKTEFKQLTTTSEFKKYQELLKQLENLSVGYILKALERMGWQLQPNKSFTSSEIIKKLNIVSQHQKLFNRFLEILAEEGILYSIDNQWQVVQVPQTNNILLQRDRLLKQYSTVTAELTLLERCGSQLAKVLQGKCDPIQLIFPDGDLTATTAIYQDTPGAKVMNTLVEKTVTLALEKLPQGRKVKFLEIGAGTGGTTSYLLPHLKPSKTEYTYTDISPLFTTKGKQKFQKYSFVKYQTLDIEKEPISQGFEVEKYDIVIVANVLHATQDLRQTLTHIRQLLAPQGLLVLLEGNQPLRWFDLIFGLTEGWWKFTDKDIRPSYPLLSTHQWLKLLKENGFNQAASLTSDDQNLAEFLQQTIIIAQKSENDIVSQAKNWLILADTQGFAQQLAVNFRARNENYTLIYKGNNYQKQTENQYQVNPTNSNDFKQLLLDIKNPLTSIINLWSLDSLNSENLTVEKLESLTKAECSTTLYLVQSCIQSSAQLPNLWLITRGAMATGNELKILGIAQSTLWGLGKVIALEHPSFNCKRVDLDPEINLKEQVQYLLTEIYSDSKEDQIAYRNHSRKVARLIRSSSNFSANTNKVKLTIPKNQPFQLSISGRGDIKNLQLQPLTRRFPNQDEVEIKVQATGLNFIDVLDALGLLPFKRNWFGVECVGEIVALGKEVKHLKIGDTVIALASGSFSQYVTVNAAIVVPKPDSLNLQEAATIPAAFLTAYYTLKDLAKIQKGERILIHAAAGGVGLAAIQIAQQAGAEVFVTAHPSKWDTLRSWGIKHIMNSRTLDFAEQVMSITKGKGVDIVLNSLSGEFIPKSLFILKEQGRFIEIGKRDVWTTEQVNQIKPHVTYFLADLMSLSQQQPVLINSMLVDLMSQFKTKTLKPLPYQNFPLQQTVSAFLKMQEGKHIGKIIISYPEITELTFKGTYLITGGLGGLGLLVARWLVEKGVRHIVLVGRTTANTTALETIHQLEKKGAKIIVAQADVAEEKQLAKVIEQIQKSLSPLRGIIHAAGVLDDGVIEQLDWERFAKVIAPKVQGAWNLHTLTKNIPLECFVLFSSAAALLGSPGQANHVAANTFLDTLAHYRQSQGLPALSINWGAWSEIGAAAQRRVELAGIGEISPQEGIKIFEQLIYSSSAQVGVVPINWSELLEKTANIPLFADFLSTNELEPKQDSNIVQQLKIKPPNERQAYLIAYLQTEVGKVLGLPSSQLPNPQQGFFDIGMDSLMSNELRNRLEKNLEIIVPSTAIFEYPTIKSLAQYILEKCFALNLLPSGKQSTQNFIEIDPVSQDNIEHSITKELEELETLLGGGQNHE